MIQCTVASSLQHVSVKCTPSPDFAVFRCTKSVHFPKFPGNPSLVHLVPACTTADALPRNNFEKVYSLVYTFLRLRCVKVPIGFIWGGSWDVAHQVVNDTECNEPNQDHMKTISTLCYLGSHEIKFSWVKFACINNICCCSGTQCKDIHWKVVKVGTDDKPTYNIELLLRWNVS